MTWWKLNVGGLELELSDERLTGLVVALELGLQGANVAGNQSIASLRIDADGVFHVAVISGLPGNQVNVIMKLTRDQAKNLLAALLEPRS